MGSMNFGLYPMLERFKTFEHEWEKPYLESSRDRIFRNTLGDIEYILTTCAENGTRFEIECYDIGHLYTLAHFADRGLVKAPFFVQSVFGILGGIGTHPGGCRAHEAHRRPAVRQRLSLVGARRRPGATADRHASRSRWAAMSASGSRIRCGSARAGSPSRAPSRSPRCARSSKGWAPKWRAPTTPARFSA